MGLIPKTVLTPIKWVSKKALHLTLLRFPGGDSKDPIACAYCPELCRFSCPTSVVTGNDAVTPRFKHSLLYKEKNWAETMNRLGPMWPIYDCTGCGRCTEYCVYEVPVADRLFEARSTHPWAKTKRVQIELNDSNDPVGDLAYELGDLENSQRRFDSFMNQFSSPAVPIVAEPKSLFFCRSQTFGHSRAGLTELYWHRSLNDPKPEVVERVASRLMGTTWLVHESVFLSRRLKQFPKVEKWISLLTERGVKLTVPFHHGNDCLDCGGEGVYARLFPDQARSMATEIWERDKGRANGILTFSSRCTQHLKFSLGSSLSILDLPSLLRKS